jgi:hypothetical protein
MRRQYHRYRAKKQLIRQAFYDKCPNFSRTGFSLHRQSPAPAGIGVHCDKQRQARNVSAVTFLVAPRGC